MIFVNMFGLHSSGDFASSGRWFCDCRALTHGCDESADETTSDAAVLQEARDGTPMP